MFIPTAVYPVIKPNTRTKIINDSWVKKSSHGYTCIVYVHVFIFLVGSLHV